MVDKTRGLRSKFSGKELLKRTEEAHQRINEYGKFGRFYSVPKGEGAPLKIWKCKEGEHIIDVIPFLAGANHHQVGEGQPTYLLDIWVHQKVGMDENDVVCLARNYNEPCPICEYINAQRLKEDLTEEAEKVLKALNPKRRCLYNIICYDSTREEARGVQLWEVAHFLFEKKILSVARNPRGGGFVPFSSPDNGKSIYFEREGSGVKNTQYLGHKFIERQSKITDELLESAYVLDELLIKIPYEDMKEALLGGLVKAEKKVESETLVEGDSIPDDANRIAQRLKAAGQTEEQKGVSQERVRRTPLAGSGNRASGPATVSGDVGADTKTGRPTSRQQGKPVASQQRRPTGNVGSGEGKRPAVPKQGQASPTRQRRRV